MYFDEETGMYYKTKSDCDKIKLWTQVNKGMLRRIEGFSRYTVTPEGVVINIARASEVKVYTNGHRLCVGLVDDSGKQRTVSLARLVASHYRPLPDDGNYYDVMFEDGNVLNVALSNLYWEARWRRHANQDNYDLDIS